MVRFVFAAVLLCFVLVFTACGPADPRPADSSDVGDCGTESGTAGDSGDSGTDTEPQPVPPAETPFYEIVTDDGSVTPVTVPLNAAEYTFFYPISSSVCDGTYLPMLLWDRTEAGKTENVRLTFCDLTAGRMTGWEYPLGDRVPGIFRQDGEDRLISGHDFDTGTEYGWRLSGPWTTPTVTELTEEEAESAYLLGDTEAVSSPDGTFTAVRKITDQTGGGGLWLENADGEGKFIRENVMLSDSVGIWDVRGYYPIVFQSSRVLVYGIGGWEWTVGYGFYDTRTGECREITNGRGVLAVRDDCVYTGVTQSYNYTEIYKEYPDGREILLADRENCHAELIPLLQYTDALTAFSYTARACGISYYDKFELGPAAGKQPLIITVFTADLDAVRLKLRVNPGDRQRPEWILRGDTLLLFAPRS